jgi:hypothetical protein
MMRQCIPRFCAALKTLKEDGKGVRGESTSLVQFRLVGAEVADSNHHTVLRGFHPYDASSNITNHVHPTIDTHHR